MTTRQEISEQLRSDREKLDLARGYVNLAIKELRDLKVFETSRRDLGYLLGVKSELEWRVNFMTDEVIDPESVFVHNMLNSPRTN